jgi:uncharacterized protein (UPF0179 family)
LTSICYESGLQYIQQNVKNSEVKNTEVKTSEVKTSEVKTSEVKNEIEAKYIKQGNNIIFNNIKYKVISVSIIPVKNRLHNKILLTLCNLDNKKIIDECFPIMMKIQIS